MLTKKEITKIQDSIGLILFNNKDQDVDGAFNQLIDDAPKSYWKKYPKEKPIEADTHCVVTIKTNSVYYADKLDIWNGERFVDYDNKVIQFFEIPS